MLSALLTKSLIRPRRQPLVKTPLDYGMEYKDIEFPSPDGVTIKGWFIPGSTDNIIIITHPMPFTRYGFSTRHQGMFKVSKVEVELLKTAVQLHNSGYHVLMLDFRNHGQSQGANNGFTGVGLHEWPDVVGALDYIGGQPELKTMDIGFVSHCMGANATIIAMSRQKDKFKKVTCIAAIQPVSMNVLVPCMIRDKYPLFSGLVPKINKKCVDYTGNSLEDMSPLAYVKDISVPVLYVQVKKDPWTKPSDIQSFYNNTPGKKELYWIEGDLERFDGYNYFGDNPRKLLEFLRRYM